MADQLEITISTPVRIGEGISAYVSYVVTAKGSFDGAAGVRDVNRRYSDFDWLRAELLKEWPGCVIPPLPSKLAPFKQELVSIVDGSEYPENVFEHRRSRLQLFLRGVAAHDALRQSKTFRLFLEASDSVFQAEQNVATMGGDGMSSFESWGSVVSGISQWLGETKEKVVETSKELAKRGGFAVAQRQKTSDDVDFGAMQERLAELSEQVGSLLAMGKADHAHASAATEAAMLRLMTPHAAEAGAAGVDELRLLAETQGRAWQTHLQQYVWMMDDQALLVGAAQQALKQREDRRFEVQAREAALGAAIGKADATAQAGAEAALRLAEQQFSVVHGSAMADVARTVGDISLRLRRFLLEHVQLQAAQTADKSRLLESAASVLESSSAEAAGDPGLMPGEQSADF